MNDKDRLLLKARSSDLEFEDDVTNFKCIKCGKLAIDHFICECYQIFCDICTEVYSNDLCPVCCWPISLVTQKDSSYEAALFQLNSHCPNKRNGCKAMYLLMEISGHLRRCKHVTPVMSTPSVSGKANYPNSREMPQGSRSVWGVPRSISIKSLKFKAIPGKEYNVVLLGTTGIGKSTFINAFTNYCNFKSLDEAVKNDPIAVIPAQFSIPDENYQQRIVRLGRDPNEDLDTKGQSATQKCKAHEFPLNDFKLRIIDTPGIGDTRGIEQDRQNIQAIFDFLSDYTDLFGVCILLKPNEARLTTQFSFCIKELLSRLHTNASKNIIFIFTNSRTTFYRPGETSTPLKTLLDEIGSTPPHTNIPYGKNNIYCLDNEAFRFLVALKNGIHFSNENHSNYGQSWLKSVEESKRMIRYIVEGSNRHQLTPHNVQDTLCIHRARDAIYELVIPLSELSMNVENHLKVVAEHNKTIEKCEVDVNKLKTKLYMPLVTININITTQPRMVCANGKCREAHQVGNQAQYHYRQICQDPCYIAGVLPDIIGHLALRNSDVIDRQTANCMRCGCHYSLHLQIYYKTEIINTQKVDSDIENQLRNKAATKQATHNILKELEVKIKNYEAEEKILTKCADKLAVFLNHNAMVIHNDASKDYLNELIENEKCVSESESGNAEIIKRLKKMLDNYETEKGILEKALNNQTSHQDHMSNADVDEIINEISNMKIRSVLI